jgi:hypothetical protein
VFMLANARQEKTGAEVLEGRLADEVDGAADGVRRHVRGRNFGQFDARRVVDRKLIQTDGSAQAGRRRAGNRHAVDVDRGVLRAKTADGNARGVGLRGVGAAVGDLHAGQELDELADVALGDVAELVRRDHVLDVHRPPLLVDRELLGVLVALGFHDKRVQHDRRLRGGRGRRCAEAEVLRRGLLRLDLNCGRLRVLPRERCRELDGSDGDVAQFVLAEIVGQREEGSARNRHDRLAEVRSGRRVHHPALDVAGRGRLGGRRADRDPEGKHRDDRRQPRGGAEIRAGGAKEQAEGDLHGRIWYL